MTETNYLPHPITLPSGIIAKLQVVPMPKPEADGSYRPRQDYKVNVAFFHDVKLIETRPLGTVICGESEVELADGSLLAEDDLEALDADGWDQLLNLGVIPDQLILSKLEQ